MSSTHTDELHHTRVVAGYKAALHNPKTSEAAKEHARQQLDVLQGYNEEQQNAHNNRVLGGFKAALHNPNTSKEAKEHARDVLITAGIDVGDDGGGGGSATAGDAHAHRVLAGYKATISNPNASDAAKAHARGILEKGGPEV